MDDPPLFDGSALPPDLDARVRAELRPGERLLWVGQPDPRRAARGACFIVAFGIPWTAFSVFWVVMASGMMFAANGPRGPGGAFGAVFACFPLFGLPFVLIGVGMLSAPYWLRRAARRTCYALTDRRALVWQKHWFGGLEVRSYGPEALTRMARIEHADGTGDLVFEEVVRVGTDTDGNRTTATTGRGFLAIGDVRRIEELVRRVLLPDPGA